MCLGVLISESLEILGKGCFRNIADCQVATEVYYQDLEFMSVCIY